MNRSRILLILGAALFFAASCAQSMPQYPRKKFGISGTATLEQVTNAVQTAAQQTQWRTQVIQPGVIEATRTWDNNKHIIVVTVLYDRNSYEIEYKSSKNLRYTGSSIHRSYAEQVGRLDAAIKQRTWNL